MPGGPSNSADFGPPTTRGLENRPKHRETDEGKSSGHPCPSTPPSASGEAFQPCDQGPGPGEARTRSEKLKEVARSQRSLTSRRESKAAISISWSGNTSDFAEPLDYISQYSREEQEPLPRPLGGSTRSNLNGLNRISQNPRKEQDLYFSPTVGVPPNTQSTGRYNFLFPKGANNMSVLSRSWSVPITGSFQTTHPRILCRAELPACQQFYFRISRWSLNKPSGTCKTWLAFSFSHCSVTNWKYEWKNKQKIILKSCYVWDKNRDRKKEGLSSNEIFATCTWIHPWSKTQRKDAAIKMRRETEAAKFPAFPLLWFSCIVRELEKIL